MPVLSHWSDAWLGRPYVAGERDCGYYAAQILRTEFGRQIEIPGERRPGPFGRCAQLAERLAAAVVRVEQPAEGDIVLMRCAGRLQHVGVYTEIRGASYVVHALESLHQVQRHRLIDLPYLNCQLEGFYRCN
ncbi:NlpC/P60 family protein [Chitiniphilus shinanonensis]|uniref:NlpC/P60 family protein n=1 Tax=Chitiniphilus shinanonensis TaxID=553088 RepID=UPI00304C9630